jgi:UDP-N-acetyl-D-mannosaminuronate dehydrogenase
MFNLIQDALNELEKSLKNSNIVVLGFSYKENVGVPCESPAKTLIKNLKWNGANVVVVDPYIEEINPKFGVLNNDLYDALNGDDALVLITPHDEFKSIDFKKIKDLMNLPIVVDGRRIYDPDELRVIGFTYKGVGAVNY